MKLWGGLGFTFCHVFICSWKMYDPSVAEGALHGHVQETSP